MKEIKNIGYIYKITNLINNKIYIGQTSRSINNRFNDHRKTITNKNSSSYEYPLYKAFRKYGIDNFNVEKVEECDICDLDDREIYWISFFDSTNKDKGYNISLGGAGYRKYNLDEQEVIKKYNELGNLELVAEFFNCYVRLIKEILEKHDIHVKSSQEIAKEKGFETYALDENKNIVKTFKTLYEAGEWVFENCEHNAKDAHSCKKAIIRAILRESLYYGFYWKSNVYDEKYIKKWNEKYKNNLNKYYKNYLIASHTVCPICGEKMLKDSNICRGCNNEKVSKETLTSLEDKISKENLMKFVRIKTFKEIGNMYGVSDNTVRKWCKRYLIPFKKEDINSISDEDWINECNLSKEDFFNKYCIEKNKRKVSDERIIKKYKEIGNIKEVSEKLNINYDKVYKVLKENNIETNKSTDIIAKSYGKIYRLDKDTNEILEVYESSIEAVDWLEKNINSGADRKSYRKSINKAIDSVRIAYGYKWRRDNIILFKHI